MPLPVEKILEEKGVAYRLIKLSAAAYTIHDVMALSDGNVNPDEICKTIILHGKRTGQKIAILLRGVDKLDFSALKKLLGEEMKIATPGEVKEAAGVEPGAVCPFLLNVPLFVDQRVTRLTTINCGSGDHLYGLEFESKDLAKATDHKIADLAKANGNSCG